MRTLATQVASGAHASVLGGRNNTASGGGSVAAGEGNTASGADAVAIGASNVASNTGATALGSNNTVSGQQSAALGDSNLVTGVGSVALGANHIIDNDNSGAIGTNNSVHTDSSFAAGKLCGCDTPADHSHVSGHSAYARNFAQRAHAAGRFTDLGDAQQSDLIWRGVTTDATLTEIFLDGVSLRAQIPQDMTWGFHFIVVGREDDGTSACWKVEGAVKNDAGATVVVGLFAPILIVDGTGGTWGLAAHVVVDADNANDALRVRVKGDTGLLIRWVAAARLVEVHHA